MYRKILAPLDGSPLAEFVLPYVEELHSRLGGKTILLRAYPKAEASQAGTHQAYVDGVAEAVRGRLGGKADIQSVAVAGEASREIVDYAKKEDVTLIAAVARGESGVGLWPVGSTADKVIRETGKAVLVIKAAASKAVPEKGILNRVLVPLDGSKLSEGILPCVETLVTGAPKKAKAEVILLQVVEAVKYGVAEGGFRQPDVESLRASTRNYLEEIGAGLRAKGVEVKSEVSTGMRSVDQEIVESARTSGANLIAMSTHGRSGFSKIFLGSVADRVLHSGDVPLLLVKPAQA
jgi:nucleotide-binding universal stress UspA family protein